MWRPITAAIASLAISAIAVAQQSGMGMQGTPGVQDTSSMQRSMQGSMQGMNHSGMSNSMASHSTSHHRRHHWSKKSSGTAGMSGATASGVAIMALQQELRDRGCSPGRITGHINSQTRHAMACARDKGIATGDSPRAMLAALNIGFSGDDTTATFAYITTGTEPSGGIMGGSSSSGFGGTTGTPAPTVPTPVTTVPTAPVVPPMTDSGQVTPVTPAPSTVSPATMPMAPAPMTPTPIPSTP